VSSKDSKNHTGIFILWLTSNQVPISEHVDRICSVLDIQAADRRRFRVDYQCFVNRQPKNNYIKFSTELVTETNTVLVSPESPRLSRSHKLLNFEGVESWDTGHEVKTCAQIISHFKLQSLTIVNPNSRSGTFIVGSNNIADLLV